MWNGPPRRVRGDPASQSEELPEVSGAYQGMAVWTSALEAARPATPTDGDAAWLLSLLRITSLQAATGRCKARGRSAVDSGAAQTQPASPAVLVLPPALFVVRTAVCGDPSRNCLTGYGSEWGLGSPVREICTPGSKWGDEEKEECRRGEATVSKETDWQGSAKATALRLVPTRHRVNHDVLMARVVRQVKDKRVLKLIRRYLKAGLMEGGGAG